MIVLLRLRSLTVFALIVLSISFIYIGYTGFSESPQVTEKNDSSLEGAAETIDPIEPVQETLNTENPLMGLNPLVNEEKLRNLDNFFVEYRMKRDKGRSAQIEILRELVNNPNSSAEVRNKAQEELFTISKSIALEVKAESLLKAKGYNEAVVVVEANNTTVVINKEGLEQTDILRIGDLIVRATGCKLEQIAIIPKQ